MSCSVLTALAGIAGLRQTLIHTGRFLTATSDVFLQQLDMPPPDLVSRFGGTRSGPLKSLLALSLS
jgi:hypothetical protein